MHIHLSCAYRRLLPWRWSFPANIFAVEAHSRSNRAFSLNWIDYVDSNQFTGVPVSKFLKFLQDRHLLVGICIELSKISLIFFKGFLAYLNSAFQKFFWFSNLPCRDGFRSSTIRESPELDPETYFIFPTGEFRDFSLSIGPSYFFKRNLSF